MKYLWYRRTRCKKGPSLAARRLQLLKEYTYRLPNKKQRQIAGLKKKKCIEDVFPPDFRWECKSRSTRIGIFLEKYLEYLPPVKRVVSVVQIHDLAANLQKLGKGTNKHKARSVHAKSSIIWSIASRNGEIMQERKIIEQLFESQPGTASLAILEDFSRIFSYKVYDWGEKGSGLHSLGSLQNFNALRRACLNNEVLFEDPFFPANEKSLCYSNWSHKIMAWKRPAELCKSPKFFIEDVSRFDVCQGCVENCWMLATLCSLTTHRKLFFQVVPLDQGFDENYAGIFHFRLWNDGKWIDVVIDDRLPVDANDELRFVHCSSSYEFWPALLEKAYAKMQGTYEHIEGGPCLEAFIEFSGGLVEVVDFAKDPHAFKTMKDAWARDSLICIRSKDDNSKEKLPEGLIYGRAYTITHVLVASFRSLGGPLIEEQLLRIHNPWGKFEWNGAWSEKSDEWYEVPTRIKQKIGLKIEEENEFWMSFKDAAKYFTNAHVCHVGPSIREGHRDKWILSMTEGEWVIGVSAGGARTENTYHMNPQYLLEVPKGIRRARVIISLLLKNRRRLKHVNYTYLPVNVSTYRIRGDSPKPLTESFFRTTHSLDKRILYECNRQIMCIYELPPGLYVVVPSSWDKAEGEFLLRFYSEKKMHVHPYDHQIGIEDEIYTKAYRLESDQRSEKAGDKDIVFIQKLFIEKDDIGNHNRQEILDKFLELSEEKEVINWVALQTLLGFALESIVPPESLSKDICRSLIALYDTNCIGALYLVQFFFLWTEIIFWLKNFERHKEGKNEIGVFSLRSVIREAGFTSNGHLLNLIMHRYGNKRGTLNLQDFLMAVIKFKRMIEVFERRMHPKTFSAKFKIDEFMEVTMYS